jgi:hypothetical protein
LDRKNGQFLLEENTPRKNNACYNEIDYHEVFFFPGKILPFFDKEIGEILVFLE